MNQVIFFFEQTGHGEPGTTTSLNPFKSQWVVWDVSVTLLVQDMSKFPVNPLKRNFGPHVPLLSLVVTELGHALVPRTQDRRRKKRTQDRRRKRKKMSDHNLKFKLLE